MKRRILTLVAVLVFAAIMVVPGTVVAETTVVSGTVIGIYVFQAPSAVEFGNMGLDNTWWAEADTAGYFVGNSPAGYTVTGNDTKATNAGYMTTSGGTPLTNKLEITDSEFDIGWVTADVGITYIDSTGPAGDSIPLYARQLTAYTDAPGIYSLNITFTIIEKS